jgi:uncharacterized membrane protein YkvA (DUF1232 family)
MDSFEEELVSRRRRKAAYTAAAAAALSEGPATLGQRVAAVPGLVRDTVNGRYDGLGRGRLAMMAVALIYIVAPIDLVPEALLTIPGLIDDAAVGAWLIASLMGATTAYRAWGAEATDPGGRADRAADPGATRGQAAAGPGASRLVVGEVVNS